MKKGVCVVKWLREKIHNKKGAILVEVLGGITIFTITVVTFGAIIAQANLLSMRAEVTANEWERIFVEMENKDYTGATVVESTDFSVLLILQDVNMNTIIDKDDNQLIDTPDTFFKVNDWSGFHGQVVLMRNQRFYQYEMNASRMVTPGTGKVEVYRIDDM